MIDHKYLEKYITTGWDRNPYFNNVEFTKHVLGINDEITKFEYKPISPYCDPYKIKKVVFNPPCTIVLWADGTKTIVRAQNNEPFDPEKGMVMAFMKKVRGNTGKYFDEIKKWVEPWEEKHVITKSKIEVDPVDLEKLKAVTTATRESIENMKAGVDKLKKLMNECVKNE